jgi:hypothetical protein
MTQPSSITSVSNGFVEEVRLEGHIIDSLLLPKVLDEILTRGGRFLLKDIRVGQQQATPPTALSRLRTWTALFPRAFTAPRTIARR